LVTTSPTPAALYLSIAARSLRLPVITKVFGTIQGENTWAWKALERLSSCEVAEGKRVTPREQRSRKIHSSPFSSLRTVA